MVNLHTKDKVTQVARYRRYWDVMIILIMLLISCSQSNLPNSPVDAVRDFIRAVNDRDSIAMLKAFASPGWKKPILGYFKFLGDTHIDIRIDSTIMQPIYRACPELAKIYFTGSLTGKANKRIDSAYYLAVKEGNQWKLRALCKIGQKYGEIMPGPLLTENSPF